MSEEGTDAEKTLCGCLATRPLACLPEAKGAMLGTLGHFVDKSGKGKQEIAIHAMYISSPVTNTHVSPMKMNCGTRSLVKLLGPSQVARMEVIVTSKT